MKDSAKILEHYLGAVLWAENDDDEISFGSKFDISDVSPESTEQAKKDIDDFITKAGWFLEDLTEGEIGYDFWMTRVGHGVGFWDRNLGATGDMITKIIEKNFPSISAYSDNGQLIIE